MKRLTKRTNEGVFLSEENEERYTFIELIDILLERLAAYEDTGLTPEDLKPGINAAVRKKLACEYFGLSTSQVSHIEELVQANNDGRLVMLPCRIDTPIYLIRTEKEPRKGEKYIVEEYDIDHFTIGCAMIPMITACSKENEWKALIDGTQRGHEFFLSREEAEKAQKERKGQ